MRDSGVEDRIFHRLDSTRFVQPSQQLLAIDGFSNMTLSGFEAIIQERLVKGNPARD